MIRSRTTNDECVRHREGSYLGWVDILNSEALFHKEQRTDSAAEQVFIDFCDTMGFN